MSPIITLAPSVTELRRRDVGPGCEMLSVAPAVTHRGACRIDTPISGKSRNVVVPLHIRAALKEHLDFHVEAEEALLFRAARGGCHLNDTVFAKSHFKPALASIGREGVPLHDLRHFAGTMTARVSGTVADTMRRLGYSTVSVSMAYQAAVDQRDVEIAAALSRLAEGA